MRRNVSKRRDSLSGYIFISFHFQFFGHGSPSVRENININMRGEWPSGLYSLRQVTEVKLGRVRSDFGWVTSED